MKNSIFLLSVFFVLTACSTNEDSNTNGPELNYHISVQNVCKSGFVMDYCVTKDAYDMVIKNLQTQDCKWISFTTIGNNKKSGYFYTSEVSTKECVNK